jgi:hypothetical protein
VTTIHVPNDPQLNLWDWLRPKLAAAIDRAITDDGGGQEEAPDDGT